jgi:hypothetical protein
MKKATTSIFDYDDDDRSFNYSRMQRSPSNSSFSSSSSSSSSSDELSYRPAQFVPWEMFERMMQTFTSQATETNSLLRQLVSENKALKDSLSSASSGVKLDRAAKSSSYFVSIISPTKIE